MPAADPASNKGGDYLGGRYYPGKVCGSRRHRMPGIYSLRIMMMYVLQFDAIATTPSGVSTMDRRLVAYRTRQFLTGISKGHRRLEGDRVTVNKFPGSQLPVLISCTASPGAGSSSVPRLPRSSPTTTTTAADLLLLPLLLEIWLL